jgi:hypothetical protein
VVLWVHTNVLVTVCFYKMLVSTHKTTQCYNPEEHQHLHRQENLKSHRLKKTVISKISEFNFLVQHLRKETIMSKIVYRVILTSLNIYNVLICLFGNMYILHPQSELFSTQNCYLSVKQRNIHLIKKHSEDQLDGFHVALGHLLRKRTFHRKTNS